jgi:hypothetical protein
MVRGRAGVTSDAYAMSVCGDGAWWGQGTESKQAWEGRGRQKAQRARRHLLVCRLGEGEHLERREAARARRKVKELRRVVAAEGGGGGHANERGDGACDLEQRGVVEILACE